MFNLIQADFFKFRKSTSIKMLFLITSLCALTMTFIAYFIAKGKFDGMNGIGFMFSDVNVIGILGGVTAGILICGDFENKMIQDAISGGNSRGTVIISKTISFLCAIVIILIPYIFITIIALNLGAEFSMGSVSVGFLNLITKESVNSLGTSEMIKILLLIGTLIIIYISQVSVCVPIALITKKPVLVVAIYYGFNILLAQLVPLGEKYSIIKEIFSFTPYGGVYSLISLDTGNGVIIKAIAVSLIFIALMIWITYIVFRKAEIK